MMQFEMVQGSSSWAVLLIGIAIYLFHQLFRSRVSKRPPQPPIASISKQSQKYSEDSYYDISALSSLAVTAEEPIKLRPFKPKYHLTMALENTSISDLIAMDKTYSSRIKLRASLLQTNRDDVLAARPEVYPAVLEFYDWMIGTYLPRRFPTVYKLEDQNAGLLNTVTSRTLPLTPSSADHALELLGANIDTDFLFLLPIPNSSPEPVKYRLAGFITCFPSGFRTRSKLGLSLAAIHEPVPGYAEKLERSMDRFFAALPVGKVVKRANWAVQTHGRLFAEVGNHMSAEEHAAQSSSQSPLVPDAEKKENEEIDIDETLLRCERQTLHRLPRTGALVFAFKTYVTPLREVREEGSGEALAEAIEGLGAGNVPGMKVYKRSVVWGESVVQFLRGQVVG